MIEYAPRSVPQGNFFQEPAVTLHQRRCLPRPGGCDATQLQADLFPGRGFWYAPTWVPGAVPGVAERLFFPIYNVLRADRGGKDAGTDL